jgi:tripartite-type tricarboxylate transporter receptor subunit TctC
MKPMCISKRNFMIAGATSALALTMGMAGTAGAQDAYPTKPVTLIVPYPAGGANDMLGRLIGQKLSERLKQQFVIDNRPGAGTLIGASQAAHATPDGYTLFAGGFASNAVAPHLFKADYDPINDFAPIGLFGSAPTLLTTYNESKYKTLKDLVDAARAKPGDLMYGSSGNGTNLHMAGASFCLQNNLNMIHVPYKGGNAHTLDLIGKRLDVIFDSTTAAAQMVKGGKLRALAVSSPQRLPDFPDVPTFAESGYPNFAVNGWYALYAPAKTPKAIVDKLSNELQVVMKMPDVLEKLRSVGVSPGTGKQDELADYAKKQFAIYGELIKAANIKAD